MTQARKRVEKPPLTLPPGILSRARETVLFVLGAVAIYLMLCLLTYSAQDPGWSHTGGTDRVANLGGRFGAWFADLMFHGFGRVAYLFPILVGLLGWRIYRGAHGTQPSLQSRLLTGAGFIATLVAGCGLETLHFPEIGESMRFVAGGVLGDLASSWFVSNFGFVGSTVFLVALFIAGVTWCTDLSWFWIMDTVGKYTCIAYDYGYAKAKLGIDTFAGARARRQRQETVTEIRREMKDKKPPRIEPTIKKPVESARREREKQTQLFKNPPGSGELPPLSLLDDIEDEHVSFSKDSLEAMSRLIEKKLNDFNVTVEVTAVHPGPVITRFEIDPAPGVKASQIVGLSRDLARALSVISVRVVENIPGKTVIGLEVPNEQRETVRLLEGLSSEEYERASSPLVLMMGKDIGGQPVIADLTKMPHLLIAGTTGAGKSVCINALVLSILFKSTAEQVRLIMVDPKMLELSVYDGIPHLLAPVVTDMKKAANALRWCIAEMDRRFHLMAALGVRNIAGYNRKVKSALDGGQPILDPLAMEGTDPEPLDTIPYIVVIIDELADLMMVVGKKIEELITRIAQRARAAGIHLILATQRPSVDVITGLIKANVPSRVAFQVSSRADSRTVLDQMGAEQLLGHGDMLFLPPGTSVPIRVHGSFVSDAEVHRVAKALKESGTVNYNPDVTSGEVETTDPVASMSDGNGGGGEEDELYDQALRFVTETRRASISAVQRQLRVGYNRAARMIEAMEQSGVVGPLESNGKRDVLAPPPPVD